MNNPGNVKGNAMEIELKKDERRSNPLRGYTGTGSWKLNPGGFDVYVDGAHWGRITTEGKGSHGILYTLCQIGGDGVARGCCKELASNVNPRLQGGRTTRLVYFTAWSDKVYLRQLKTSETRLTIAARLTNLVASAIKDGALRDPTGIEAESKKLAAEHHAREAEAIQAKTTLWRTKAAEAIAPYRSLLSSSAAADLLGRIVRAMEWAQSQ